MKKDESVLNCLREFYASRHAMPSFAELGKHTGVAVSTLAGVIARLKSAHYLDATETGRLTPGKRFFERPLANHVQAGFPVPVSEVVPEGLLIDEYLVDSPSRTLLLSVRGESMVDAGLLPDDVVIVKRGAVAREGEIVIAIVDGDYTVKYLAFDDSGNPFLKPGNAAFPNIYPVDELEIFGVVTGSFRKYARRALAPLSPQAGPP